MAGWSQVKPGDKVLDVGCGSGRLTLAAQKWAGPQGEAVGIDPSPEMIQVARQNAERAGLRAKFELGMVEAVPFPDGTFDVVLNRLMLHHLPGDLKQRGLAEMRRVLKPGGLAWWWILNRQIGLPAHAGGKSHDADGDRWMYGNICRCWWRPVLSKWNVGRPARSCCRL